MTQILVIEDDPTQRLLTSSVLRSAGYDVAEAADGAEGLALAQQAPPDLIVCDVVMPGMNGYELVALLRQEARFSSIPIILLSAMADRLHMRAGMTAGADDYLHKPFRAAELRKSVEILLSKRELQRVQFARASKTAINAALDQQKESLASRYENRLVQELNERWVGATGAGQELNYVSATVLSVNIFATVVAWQPSREAVRGLLQQVYQGASDLLYLFGARYLVPAGDELLAVFPESSAADACTTRMQALRSAFGIQKMVEAALGSAETGPGLGTVGVPCLTIALHTGSFSLFQLDDPLHGSLPLTLAAGPAVQSVRALAKHAQEHRWQVSCTAEVITGIARWITSGERALLPNEQGGPQLDVMQLRAVAPPA